MDGEVKENPAEFEIQLKELDSNIEELAEVVRELERRLEKVMLDDHTAREIQDEKTTKLRSPVSTHLYGCNERIKTNHSYIVGILRRLDL